MNQLSSLPFKIDPMTLADIPAVTLVEQTAYASNYIPRNYAYELQQNKAAHYFVLRHLSQSPAGKSASRGEAIIGGGGFWLMADEFHISSIAIHPGWQHQGWGEWLLISLLEAGQTLKAHVATLEVRISNHLALALYQKYNFQQVGRRRSYYNNNNEDAFILTTPDLTLPHYQTMLSQRKATLRQRLAQINDEEHR